MKDLKRILSSILVICFLVSLAPAAFAAEDATERVVVSTGETETVGNVTVTSIADDAVYVDANSGGSATLNVEGDVSHQNDSYTTAVDSLSFDQGSVATVNVSGNVEASSPDSSVGVSSQGSNGGNSVVNVDGSVTVQTPGAEPVVDENGYYMQGFAGGVDAVVSGEAGFSSVTVGGEIVASGISATGVSAQNYPYHYENGEQIEYDPTTAEITVSVGSDITVTGTSEATGVFASAVNSGTTNVTVGGDISSSAPAADGVYSTVENNGSLTVEVNGSVEALGSSTDGTSARAVNASVRSGGEANVNIDGDVTADATNSVFGVNADTTDGGTTSVTVSGDLLSKASGTDGSANGFSSTLLGTSGSTSVTVDGDVTVSSDASDAIGVVSFAQASFMSGSVSTTGSAAAEVGGDLTVSASGDATGVMAFSNDGGSTEVTIGGALSATAADTATGMNASAYNASTIDVSVGGDVVVAADSAVAASIGAGNDCTANALFNGDITADASSHGRGLDVWASSSGSAAVTVNGDITADSDDFARGLSVDANNKSQVDVTVNGDINATGEKLTFGAQANSGGESSLVLVLNGSVNADASEEGYGVGMNVNASNGADLDLTINGDLSSSGTALSIYIATPSDIASSKADITVDGTISGVDKAISFTGDADALTLTVWKVELDQDGHAVTPDKHSADDYPPEVTADELSKMDEVSAKLAEEVEQNILYIIKLEQPKAGGTLSLSGTTKSGDFDVAKEGESVYLLVTVAEGYQLDGAYNGDGTRVELRRDDDGNYFLVVPRGGGVYLTADLSLIPIPEEPPVVYRVPRAPAKTVIVQAETESVAEEAPVDASGDEAPAEEPISVSVVDESNKVINVDVDVTFFSDKTFEVALSFENGSTMRIEGTFKFVDGALTLALKDGTKVTINEDGILLIPLSNGTVLHIRIDQATIDNLKRSVA